MYKVKFCSVKDVLQFVEAMELLPYDIDLIDGRRVIDAKSLCGVLGLDLSKIFQVRVIGEEPDFADRIEKWKV